MGAFGKYSVTNGRVEYLKRKWMIGQTLGVRLPSNGASPHNWVGKILLDSFSSRRRGMFVFTFSRAVYHHLPLKYTHKRRLKNFVYRCLGIYHRAVAGLGRSLTGRSNDWSKPATYTVPKTPRTNSPRAKAPAAPSSGANADGPAISVIIPVYNQLDYTLQCLESIFAAPPASSFEVIVVDDASQDETPSVLSARSDIIYIRQDQNGGFIKTCNKGAAAASGEYLLFLNNDTQIVPGWADELLWTFRNVKHAGLVGSKLVYPDGKLQEAGGIVWNDGSGANFGKGDDPDKPEYNYLREVDYISGASIMVPKSLFVQIGGFDDHYAPAYYEDTDLAFKIRQYGLRVLYQPLSRVIHYEGITSGTDINSGVKAYQVENAKKFYQRWQGELGFQGEPGNMTEQVRDRGQRRRALVIDSFTPTPDKDSGSNDTVQLFRMLDNLSYQTTFIPNDLQYLGSYTEDLQRIGVQCLCAPYIGSVDTHLKKFGKKYDLLVLKRIENASLYMKLARKHCPNAKVVFDTVDVQYIRVERQAEIEGSSILRRQAAQARETELQLMADADATVVLSSAEYEALVNEVPRHKLFLIPFVREAVGRSLGFSERRDLMFVGGFKHQPNVDAVQYFVRDIFPLIKEKLPDVKLHIIGSNPTGDIYRLESEDVIVVGYVEDLGERMERHRISVAPLRYGAGIKGKVVSSLAHGLPCVASPIAVEGMEVELDENVLVGEDPAAFAQAVINLYSDEALWQKLSDNGLDYVESRYSLAAGLVNFGRMLAEIGAPPFHGDCNVCGSEVSFEIESDNFRESLRCPECGASSRIRCLAEGLLREVAKELPAKTIRDLSDTDLDLRILDTDNFSSIRKFLKGRSFYATSAYLPDKKNGQQIGKGAWNVDLMDIPFDDETYDVIVTSDVMEHVRRDTVAHEEILRCLKPGGKYIFTVPYVPGWAETQVRVDTTGDTDIFLMEKEYHGDPLSKDGVLVYRIFGRQLLADLKAVGFSDVKFEQISRPENGIVTGGLWVCTK